MPWCGKQRSGTLIRLIQRQQVVVGIVIEQFAVTAPLHGDGELLVCVLVGIPRVQQIQHEFATQMTARGVPQRMFDIVYQRHMLIASEANTCLARRISA